MPSQGGGKKKRTTRPSLATTALKSGGGRSTGRPGYVTSPQNPSKIVNLKRENREWKCLEKNKHYRKGAGCVNPPSINTGAPGTRKKRADAGMTRAQYRQIKAGKAKGIKRGELVY